MTAAEAQAKIAALTPRQKQLFDLLMADSDRDRGAKEIAFSMGITYRTLQVHRDNLHKRLDIHSRGEMCRLWRLANGQD